MQPSSRHRGQSVGAGVECNFQRLAFEAVNGQTISIMLEREVRINGRRLGQEKLAL